jgi:hypothetical protein
MHSLWGVEGVSNNLDSLWTFLQNCIKLCILVGASLLQRILAQSLRRTFYPSRGSNLLSAFFEQIEDPSKVLSCYSVAPSLSQHCRVFPRTFLHFNSKQADACSEDSLLSTSSASHSSSSHFRTLSHHNFHPPLKH